LPSPADIVSLATHVRKVPRADKPAHLIHLVGAGEQCRGDHKSQRFGGLNDVKARHCGRSAIPMPGLSRNFASELEP
jgi:hypothetical protein